MKGIKLPVLPILALVAIVVISYALYKNVVFKDVEYFSEATDEVKRNPVIAAARFLQQAEGFEFQVAKDRGVLTELSLSNPGVLWILDISILESQREVEHILEWINNGGVLLTSPAGNNTFDDDTIPGLFLQELGLRSFLRDDEPIRRSEKRSNIDTSVWFNDSQVTLPVTLFSEYEQYFSLQTQHQDDAQTYIDSPYLIHRARGEGVYTVYADEQLFTNSKLTRAKSQQAYALLWLTQPAKNKTLTIVHRPSNKPGLFSVIWNKFTLSVLLFGVALISFLRWATLRLGPVEQELPSINNNLIAHLEARGSFWHKHKYAGKILAEVQQAAIEKLSPHQRNKAPESLSEIDRAAIVKMASEQLGCDQRFSESILFGKPKTDAATIRTTNALQKLLHRKQLNPTPQTAKT